MSNPVSASFLVKLSHSNVALGGKRILSEIDWTISAGESWRIQGPNGAGKSTLLRLVAGQLWPVASPVPSRYYGFNHKSDHRLLKVKSNIGFASYAMQDEYVRSRRNILAGEVMASGFNQALMLYDCLTLSQQQELTLISQQLKLEGFLNSPFLSLSHGQKSIILFARAIIHKPRLLVLDEISNGIDKHRFTLMLSMLENYKRQGGQIILSWHETGINALESLFTHEIMLKNGAIEYLGAYRSKPDLKKRGDCINIQAPVSGTSAEGGLLLELRDIQVYRGNRHILKGINWSIHSGERWLLSGENGSGKTTLLKTLLAETRPAVGGVLNWACLPKNPSVWALRKLIGYVSPELQQAYHYNISVEEVVASGFFASIGLYQSLGRLEHQRVKRVARQFQLEALLDDKIHQLSCGQLRRVLIARAMVLNPEILLFDEILANLDQSTRRQISALINDLASQGKTMIMVSHHEQEFEGLYNRKAVLKEGRLKVKS